MRYLLRYHLRLGDIVRCLPIAESLTNRGHTVYFETLSEYAGVFDLVDYAEWVEPGTTVDADYDRVLDLQVWPERYEHYRQSGRTWTDFVFGLYDECLDVTDRRPRFSRVPEVRFTKRVALVAPFGFSQLANPEFDAIMAEVGKVKVDCAVVLASPQLAQGPLVWNAPTISALAAAIKAADYVFTVDTAPNILAAAVGRDSWHYFPNPVPNDGYFDERQHRIPWRLSSGRLVS